MRHATLIMLALKQISKERFIYSCQVFAISAILIPLLIILGLKHGMISSMKQQLLSNPSALELRQSQSFQITQENIDVIRSWPETQFAIALPDINGVSVRAIRTPSHEITLEDHSKAVACDIKSSAMGDPLMIKSQCVSPRQGELVVSSDLAKKLDIQQGASITLSVSRNHNTQLWSQAFTVSHVLPPWATRRTELYANQQLVNFIEEYKRAGKGVAGAPAEVNFDAYQALVLTKTMSMQQGEDLAKQASNMLFELSHRVEGLENGTPMLHRKGLKIGGIELNQLMETAAIQDRALEAYPWNAPIDLHLAEKAYRLVSRGSLFQGSATLCEAPPQVYINPASFTHSIDNLLITSPDGVSNIVCAIVKDKNIPQGELWSSPQLAALAHQASRMLISWDYRAGSLRYPRARSLGLRLYSKGLEETERLYHKMRALQLPCHARLASIRQLLELERGLNIIFLIISTCAGLGASLALAFNLFNAIERHRKDYALLQLLGVGKYSLMMLPLIESLLITLVSIALSLSAFYAVSEIISFSFAQYEDASSICQLTQEHLIYLTCISTALAFLSSLASCMRMLSITPSEIIRES